MIPVKLTIQGLYSYQDIQEVDFRRLTGSNVFGIFGKVGSGKTSLLEAISFALYGRTERLNDQDKRAYNMMNLKSNQLRIDFEFQAGPDHQLYRFVYEANRHPKKHGEIAPGERRMFIRQANDWHPIGNEKEDVSVLSKEILGLDYDNFKRTIIIPQNQFREFLELTPRDRTEMMNRLFKLDQYDLAGRVSKLSRTNDTQLAELRGLLSPLADVTPDAIEQAQSRVSELTNEIHATDVAIDRVRPEEQRLLDARNRQQALDQGQRELARLQTQEPVYVRLRQTVNLYQTCRLIFQADLVSLRKLLDKVSSTTQTREKVSGQLNKLTSSLPALHSIYEAAKQAYDSRHQIQHQIDELDTVQTIRTTQESIERQSQHRQQLLIGIDRQTVAVEQYRRARADQQTAIDNQLSQESELARLHQIEKWFVGYKPLAKQADDLERQLTDYEATLEQIKSRKTKALVDFPADWETYTLKTLPAQIDKALHQLKAARKQQETSYRQAFVRQEFAQYADALTDGMPCPVCGSAHHPVRHGNAVDAPDSDAIRQDVKVQEQTLNDLNLRIDQTTSLRIQIEGLANELRGALENGKRLIQERTDVVRERTEHEDLFVWSDFDKNNEGHLTDAIRTATEQQQQLRQKQQLVRELTQQIEESEANLTREEKKLAEGNNAIAGLNGQLKIAVESLEHYRLAEVATWNLRQIADLRDSLTRSYERAGSNFDAASEEKTKAGTLHATLTEQLQHTDTQLTELSDEIRTLEDTLNQNLTEQGLTRDSVEQVLQSKLDIDQEKRRITDYDDQCAGLRRQVADLETELAQSPFDAAALLSVQQQLGLLRQRNDELNRDLGKASNMLNNLQKQWAEKQTHQTRFDELDLRRQDLKKMDDMFRAQGFVNYVSSVYLKNLCESANARFFKLTNNQLKLELDEKNNFQVRDFLNGGAVRSVKTLSGGQMFQASLSLALALSDNIQHLTKARQHLFFLDEGFGTLDKDALQTVFKTLKALRSENRVVGIISHVEELQHEVDTYIRAEASENGSRIVRSWEE